MARTGRPRKEPRKHHHITLSEANSQYLNRITWGRSWPYEKSAIIDRLIECKRKKLFIDPGNLRPKYRL